jgi:hypothetical protein
MGGIPDPQRLLEWFFSWKEASGFDESLGCANIPGGCHELISLLSGQDSARSMVMLPLEDWILLH